MSSAGSANRAALESWREYGVLPRWVLPRSLGAVLTLDRQEVIARRHFWAAHIHG